LATKPAELNMHSTGTEAADEADRTWNRNYVVLLKAKANKVITVT